MNYRLLKVKFDYPFLSEKPNTLLKTKARALKIATENRIRYTICAKAKKGSESNND